MSNQKGQPIVFFVNRFAVGGAERQVIDDVNELFRRGVNVELVTLRGETEHSLRDSCLLGEGKLHCVQFNSLFDLRAWKRLHKLLRRLHPRAVVSHLWFANTIARISGVLALVPTRIVFEQNVYDSVKTNKQFFIDWFLQFTSTRIIAVSEAVKDSLVRHGIQQRRISVLINAVDTKEITDVPEVQVRNELGLPRESFLFLSVGRLTKQKAHDVLIEAFSYTEQGFLIIIGEGEERVRLEELVVSLGVRERVFLLGIRHDVTGVMKACDCFVFPSRWEGVGIVMLEAMAAGAPIVITDFPAARGIVEHGKNGLVVPVDDVQALSSAMSLVMSDKVLKRVLVSEGKKTSLEYGIENHVNQLLVILEQNC